MRSFLPSKPGHNILLFLHLGSNFQGGSRVFSLKYLIIATNILLLTPLIMMLGMMMIMSMVTLNYRLWCRFSRQVSRSEGDADLFEPLLEGSGVHPALLVVLDAGEQVLPLQPPHLVVQAVVHADRFVDVVFLPGIGRGVRLTQERGGSRFESSEGRKDDFALSNVEEGS